MIVRCNTPSIRGGSTNAGSFTVKRNTIVSLIALLASAQGPGGFSPMNAELLAGAEFRKADITFDREYTVDLGGVRARLIAMGNNHTRGDTAIFIEPDGVLFSGDVTMPALPAIAADAGLRQWLTSQQRFEALRPKRIVPSHGAMGDASMVANYKTFFDTILGASRT